MKIHIIGAGEVGRHMALSLSADGHDVTLVEQDECVAHELDAQLDAQVLVGNGCSPSDLAESGVAECELFLALTSCNNANLVSCSIAKQLGAPKALCRVHPSLQREEWMFDFRKQFNVDYIFSSERLSSIELAKSICNPTSMVVEEIARGKIELQQVVVSELSDSVGKSLLELNPPGRVRVAAVTRGDESFVPNADTVIHTGDRLTVVGEPRKLRGVVTKLLDDMVAPSKQKVVIFGGGEYGHALAEMLQSWDFKTRILEENPARAQLLAEILQNIQIINVDATSLTELREEQVGEADFFVACSANDEDNVMTCLQAHSLGTKHCLTLIHRADYADAISANGQHLGINAAVSPREATRLELMRFVTGDRYHVFKELAEGEIIEMTVPERSVVSGKKISEIAWPSGSIVVALIRDSKAVVPDAQDVVECGDNLYAMVAPEAKKLFINLVSKKS